MKLTCAGTKKSPTYYVQKSIRIGNKTTTKTVERLGSIEEIKARCGDQDPIEWAKEYTKKLTLAEKEAKQGILLKYSASTLIDKNVRRSCNAGYLFLQDIYYALGLDRICAEITAKYKFDYDLNDILSMLVYSRIISPGSKISSLENAQRFIEQPKCSLHQIYRALEVIARENDFFKLNFIKTLRLSLKEKRTSSTMIAPTTTLKLKKKTILENMVVPRNTVQIQSYRWDYLWMQMAFRFLSLYLMEIKTNSHP